MLSSRTTCTCDLTLTGSTFVALTAGLYPCSEPLEVVTYDLYCDASGVAGTVVLRGLVTGYMIRVTVDEALIEACQACTDIGSFVTVISSDLTVTCPVLGACATGVWRTLNPMDLVVEASLLNYVEWEFLDYGLVADSALQHPVAGLAADLSVYPDDLWLTQGSNMLWALDAGSGNHHLDLAMG